MPGQGRGISASQLEPSSWWPFVALIVLGALGCLALQWFHVMIEARQAGGRHGVGVDGRAGVRLRRLGKRAVHVVEARLLARRSKRPRLAFGVFPG